MGTHIAGKYGNVYGSALLVEDCEAAWDEHTNAHVVETADDIVYKVGTYSAKFAVDADAVAGELLSTHNPGSKNLTTYDGVYWWARSSVTSAAGGLQLILSETAECGVEDEALNFPALAINTWKQCFARLATPSALNAVISVGLHYVTDIGAVDLWIDDVEALAEIDGIKSWTLDYTADTLETTDFDDAGIKAYIVGGSNWSGSFEGYKDGVPLGIGSEVYLTLGESISDYQNWIGKVFITGAHPNTSSDGIVTYSYDFQGTGELGIPGA